MARDERVFITGEDVGQRGGVFRATLGLFEKYGADRVIDSPLAELSIVAVGIGAAMAGMRPICEIQFADYIFPAFNQIINEAALVYYRSNGGWPYGGGIGGGIYHSQSVEAYFAHAPGLKIVVPSTAYDAKGLLKSAVRDPNPVMIFEPKKGYRLIRGEVPEDDYTVPIGPAQVTRQGDDLTVYAYGMMHYYTLQAAEMVAQQDGIQCEVVDLRTLVPLDRETVLSSFKKTGKALIVYEDNRFLGYGAEIAAILSDEAFEYMDGPIRRLAGPDVPGVPFAPTMQDYFMPGPQKIADAMRELAGY
jgi:2-oxoisovalerate dehydrogenase E1 component beta subunit